MTNSNPDDDNSDEDGAQVFDWAKDYTVPDDHDRQSSILTNFNREYLDPDVDNEMEPGSSHDRTTRSRLWDRLREGIRDWSLIFEWTEDRDRRHVLPGDTVRESQEWESHAMSIIAFLYLRYRGNPGYPDENASFEHIVTQGIRRALNKEPHGMRLADSEVVFKVETEDRIVAQARERYENGEPMRLDDIHRLRHHGILPKSIRLRLPDEQSEEEIPEVDPVQLLGPPRTDEPTDDSDEDTE